MKSLKYVILIVFGIVIGFVISKYQNGTIETNNKSFFFEQKSFEEIWDILNQSYYDTEKLNTGNMQDKALKAFVDGINDPYTVYLDEVEFSGFESSLEGEEDFEGIGAVVKKKDYYVLVEEVLNDSPALKSGLKPLDRIIAVDTGSVKDLDIYQAIEKIKGPKGTTVSLLIERVDRNDEAKKEIFQLDIIREEMKIPSVMTKVLELSDGQKCAYIDISVIGEKTEVLFQQSILDIKGTELSGVIIDLRGNGGGLLPVAVQIASHFISKGDLITTAKYRFWEDENYYSLGYQNFENLPVVVLVNDYTASAGEIISLALQEQVGAKIIGTKTFGKGSIQTLGSLQNGDSIKYTVGKRYSPSGKNIDEVGVSPDFEIDFDYDNYISGGIDNQLEKAKEILMSR